ncbi:MAG: hypothetical protein IJS78_04165 [Clostridia bacterium]|nr:hypothetical protein [Clostridia bacterium]
MMKKQLAFFVLIIVAITAFFTSCGSGEKTLDTVRKKAEEDIRYKWILSFIEKDAKKCAEMMFLQDNDRREEAEGRIKDEFSKYRVVDWSFDEKDDEVVFSFEVADSKSDAFCDGNHEYIVEEGIPVVTWKEKNPDEAISDDDLAAAVSFIVPEYKNLIEEEKNEEARARISYISVNRWKYSAYPIPADLIDEASREIFRKKLNVQDNPAFDTASDGITLKQPGGKNMRYRILDVERKGNELSVTVQTFADPMGLTCSDLIILAFEKLNGAYPFALVSVNILNDSPAEPYVRIS